jgi:hypothetical protein
MIETPIIPDPGGGRKCPPRPGRNGHGGLAEYLRSGRGARLREGTADAAVRESDRQLDEEERALVEADPQFVKLLSLALELADDKQFPLWVFPRFIRDYVAAWSVSLYCSPALLAVPLLAVAGAATGRLGRRLRVKDGWEVSSCLWAVCLAPSSDGKSPALNAVQNFYDDRQDAEMAAWQAEKQAHDLEPESCPPPGPYPTLKVTDTTLEALRSALAAGPVLYSRDELSAWCHQMGQYKQGNADRPDWTSFWSHAPVHVGRKTTEPVYVKEPFVAVAGMMVPESAPELNYRGHGDDGFVHRILIACPKPSRLVFSTAGVPEELTRAYKARMAKLFEPGESSRLVVAPGAFKTAAIWCNTEHYAEVEAGLTHDEGRPAFRDEVPAWRKAKYKKLWENMWRLCLVLNELWRVAGDDDERGDNFDEGVVGGVTLERAIAVVNFFKDHIDRVQEHLGHGEKDDVDAWYDRFRSRGTISVRDFMRSTAVKRRERILGVFAAWEKRGYGRIEDGGQQGRKLFRFGPNGRMRT